MFIISEIALVIYARILADYSEVDRGQSIHFGGDFGLYWNVLILIIAFYTVMLLIKFFLLNLCILMASGSIHETMIDAIVRSPAHFFDSTPSGILVNKFSNDFGILDFSLVFALIDALEGPILVVITIVNLTQIDLFFFIPFGIFLVAGVMFFVYIRPVILKCKELDLQNKNPLFHFFSENFSGLTQIRIYKQGMNRLQHFSVIVNHSLKAAISYGSVARGYGLYQ